MTKEYFPASGSIVAYVVALLHSLPIGAEVDTTSICEALDVGIASVISGTGAAVEHGFIYREKVASRYLWRRGPTQVDDAFIAAHPQKNKVNVDPSLRATLQAKEATRPPAPYSPPPPVVQSLSDRFAQPRVIPGDEDEHPVLVIRKAIAADTADAAAAALLPPEPAPVARRKADTPPLIAMRAGLWSDGSLHIERAGRVETFTPSETQYLMRFLDGMLLRTRDVTVG